MLREAVNFIVERCTEYLSMADTLTFYMWK